MERLKHDTARALRSDYVGEPGCTASGRTGNHYAIAGQVVGITIKLAASRLNRAPVQALVTPICHQFKRRYFCLMR
jgi:hypothetical protein